MYAHIRGVVDAVFADRAVVEAAGVGYELFCSANTIKKLTVGTEYKLFTHFHLSQDAVALYGFHTESERLMFRRLIGVTRIGPKVALNVLSVLSPDDVALAIMTDNAAAFDRVQGMGRKTAARVILELKEKVQSLDTVYTQASDNTKTAAPMRTEAIAALVALGYDGAVAGRAVASVDDCDRIEDMVRLALRELAKK